MDTKEYEFSFNKLSFQPSLNLKDMSECKTIINESYNNNNLNIYSCYPSNSLQREESIYNSKSLDSNPIIDIIKRWWKEKYPQFARTCVSKQRIKNVLFYYSVGDFDVDDCNEWE